MSPGPVRTVREMPARRHVLGCVAAVVGVYLAQLEHRSFRACTTTTTDDPRLAVVIACSTVLATAYRVLLLLVLTVTGARRYRTHRREHS